MRTFAAAALGSMIVDCRCARCLSRSRSDHEKARHPSAWFVVVAAITLPGCLGFPAIEVKDNTYGDSPVGKYAYGLPALAPDFVDQTMGTWFNEECPVDLGDARSTCARTAGMTCIEGVLLDCSYSAQETIRRRDKDAPGDSREWRTIALTIFVEARTGEKAKVRSQTSSTRPQ